MTKLLIEGDEWLHHFAAAGQRSPYVFIEFTGGYTEAPPGASVKEAAELFLSLGLVGGTNGAVIKEPTSIVPLHTVKRWFTAKVHNIQESLGADEVYFAVSPGREDNFRFHRAMTKKYKGNRDGKDKPIYYQDLKAWLLNQTMWTVEIAEKREADDAIMEKHCAEPGSIVVSFDKDLAIGSRKRYDILKEELYELGTGLGDLVLEEGGTTYKCSGNGLRWFYAQVLIGDSVDNIPGCPGIGHKKAYDILSDLNSDEAALAAAALNQYLNCKKLSRPEAITMFLEMVDLLWIRERPNQWKSEEIAKMLHISDEYLWKDRKKWEVPNTAKN